MLNLARTLRARLKAKGESHELRYSPLGARMSALFAYSNRHFQSTAMRLVGCLGLFLACGMTTHAGQQSGRLSPAQLELEEGLKLYRAGNLPGAVRRFRTATELAPALEDAHVSLGAALLESGDLDGAQAEFDLTLKNDPTTAEADTRVHIGKGAVYRKKKAFVLAVHEYQEALKLDVSNADAHNGLGLAYQDPYLICKCNVSAALHSMTSLRSGRC